MSKLWGAVQSGADPIGGVLPMDAESSGFKLRRVGAFNDIRCRAKPSMTGLLSFFSSLATIFRRFAPDAEFSRP